MLFDPMSALPPSSAFTGLVGPIVPGFFVVDELSLAVLASLGVLWMLLILCTPATTNFPRHLILLLFFFASAFGVVTAANAVTFFGCWEICTLFAWALSRLAGDAEVFDDGVMPFHAAGALGSFAMLFGLALLVTNRHSLILGPVGGDNTGPIASLFLIGILLNTYGLLAESWNLQPNHRFTVAGGALAGAGVLTIGMYPFFRLFGPVLGGTVDWRGPAFWVATVLLVVSAFAALGEADYRRALAHGAFSQFWLMVLIFSIGSRSATAAAVAGAVADAFAFTGLFLCLSVAEEATAQVQLGRVGGLAQRLPITAGLFLICSVSIVGLPPLGGFVVDGLLGSAVVASLHLFLIWMIAIALTLAYLARLFTTIFLGELRGPVQTERRLPAILASGGVVTTLVLLGTMAGSLLTQLAPMLRLIPG